MLATPLRNSIKAVVPKGTKIVPKVSAAPPRMHFCLVTARRPHPLAACLQVLSTPLSRAIKGVPKLRAILKKPLSAAAQSQIKSGVPLKPAAVQPPAPAAPEVSRATPCLPC